MHVSARTTLSAVFLLLASSQLLGQSATLPLAPSPESEAEGKAIFTAQCKVCHMAEVQDGGGGQGPALGGLSGQRSGTLDPVFGYTAALRDAGLVWDKSSLDRFLADPAQAVAGTAMPVAVTDPVQRSALVAYLLSLRKNREVSPSLSSAAGHGWNLNRPGQLTHLRVQDLPAPHPEESARNFARQVPPPPGVALKTMAGFKVERYPVELEGPRTIRVAPNGDVFIAETPAGRVRLIRPGADGARPAVVSIFAKGLERPFGIAFYPEQAPRWVYVGDGNSVKRFAYHSGDLTARSPAETVVAQLGVTAGGHWSRDIVFSRDGKRMFVAVGSGSNVADEPPLPSRTPEEIRGWESSQGLGAAWGDEADRANVLSFTPDGQDRQRFATGIRNCVGLSRQPATGDLFCSTNERDALGNDLVPDYLTRVRQGHFYGWPWYYIGDHQDPRHAGERPDLKGKVTVPDVLFQSHSAPIHTAFYPLTPQGPHAFPKDFRGDAFVALRGSWNRVPRTGYKIVRVPFKNGVPTGAYQDFVTGFVVDDQDAWGRPYGIAVLKDGSLLFDENGSGTVWRVTYSGRK